MATRQNNPGNSHRSNSRNIGVIGRMGSVRWLKTLRQLKNNIWVAKQLSVILEEDTASILWPRPAVAKVKGTR